MHLYITGFWILLLTLTAIAWLGRPRSTTVATALREPETGVATLLLAAAVLTVLLRPSVATRFVGIDPSMVLIDAGLFVGLASYGVRSGRWWVLCAAALQLISTTAHLARVFTPDMWRLGYQVMEEASSYPTLMLLAWGVWSRHRRARSARRSSSFSVMPGRDASPRR
ncbi:hypothetical protein [Sphingomonas sp. R86520]|uniref:hypothetical protein n=1 Tax=Sphingomonas sp. R86520 TaxID=3093859 RepID=UPI0036D231BD